MDRLVCEASGREARLERLAEEQTGPMFNGINLLQAVPSRTETRVSRFVMVLLLFGFLAALPFAAVQWPASNLLYAGAGIATFAEITTGGLLITQAFLLRHDAGLVLGFGYLLGGLIVLIDLLLAHGTATRLWLFRLWHGVFVLSVLAYAILNVRGDAPINRSWFARRARWAAGGSGLALTAVLIYLAVRPFPLPPILHGTDFITLPDLLTNGVQLVVMIAACLLLLTTKRKTVLSIWMAAVALSTAIDIVLFVLGGKLFSVGLYVSKLNNLVSGTLIFGVIFYHAVRVQSELLRANRRLTWMALSDTLTGLPNRCALLQKLPEAMARTRRDQRLLAVCMMDLDDFKSVNDAHGHVGGDQVLREIAHRLQGATRETDTVVRLSGDEFVLLLEGIERMDDLEQILERVHVAIMAPITLENGGRAQIQASLGLAFYPLAKGGATSDGLLRLADQALYRAKAHKGRRTQWWILAGDVEKPEAVEWGGESKVETVPAYGAEAARRLVSLRALLGAVTERFIGLFYAGLARESVTAMILDALPPGDLGRLKAKQCEHLNFITNPVLEESAHREAARRLGRAHAAVGVDRPWLIQSYGLWMDALPSVFAREPLRLRLAQPVLARRMALEVEFELEGYAEVDCSLDRVHGAIEDLAWHAEQYTDLIEGAVLALLGLEQVAAATIARPDAEGVLQYEAIAGEPFRCYLEQLKAGKTLPIRIDFEPPEGRGTSYEAWHSGEIQHVLHYATDPRVVPWREVASGLGIRSSAAVPLRIGGAPVALLLIFSRYAGGYTGSAQRALLEHLQRVLSLGLERLRQAPRVQAAPERRRYRHLLASGGLEMFYQPVVDLKHGELVKVEALARLHEDDAWFTPDRFLPAFGHEDLYALYRLGLDQALQALDSWRAPGLVVDVSLNLPPRGLSEPRYLEATRQALAAHPLPAGRHLSVEILETEELQQSASVGSMLAPWRELGVQFAQDDLGSGHSSLVRLRRICFEEIKIDRGLVRGVAADPLRVLRFIARLTDLAQEAGARVVVEGLESLGLIEAAAILGADLGQGYAIARPLAAGDLLAWAGIHPPLAIDPARPRTALGVLAESIRWEQRLAAVSAWPEILRQLAARPCAEGCYLHERGLEASPLGEAHEAMHIEIARDGNLQSPAYRNLHERHLALLVERATEGENGAD